MDWIVEFFEGTLYYFTVGAGLLAVFAVLSFVTRRVLRLPPADRYWWIGAITGGAGLVGRIVHADGFADLMFVVLILYLVWFVLVRGVTADDLDKDMFDSADSDGGGDV